MKGGGGGKRGKKGGKGKGGGGAGGDIQVNLIVDPHAFNFDPYHDDEDNIGESDDDDGGMLGSFPLPEPRRKGRGRHQRRCGILAGLVMEESWRHARGWAKNLAIVDVAGVVL